MLDSFKFKEAIDAFANKLRGVQDRVRFRSDIVIEVRDQSGRLKGRSEQHNLRVNAGADFWNQRLFGTWSASAGANYIALSTDTTPPAPGDTSLPGEIASNGLGRAGPLVAVHTPGTTRSLLSNTFTYLGSTPVAVAKIGLFNASAMGTLVLESLLSSTGTVSASGDTIAINWTVWY